MNNAIVAHLWANEKKECAAGSNFYFKVFSIYSFGSHYEAGRIVYNKRGEKAYIVNSTGYSNCTSKHLIHVRSAIPTGSTVFNAQGIQVGKMDFVIDKLDKIRDSVLKFNKYRTDMSYLCIWSDFTELLNYLEFFDMGTPKQLLKKNISDWLCNNECCRRLSDKKRIEKVHELKQTLQIMLKHQASIVTGALCLVVDDICGEGTWGKYLHRCDNWKIKQGERLKNRQEMFMKTYEEKIELWRKGESCYAPAQNCCCGDDKPNAYLRVHKEKIETSKGISVSKVEAKRLWSLIKYFHEGGQFHHDLTTDFSGQKWSINKYENDLLVAGCHRIAYGEMESIAKQLGFIQ